MFINVFKVFAPMTAAFFVGILITPLITHYLYKHQLWKKKAGKVDPSGQVTPIFNQLHAHKEVGTPRMGGVVIWGSALITIVIIWLVSLYWPSSLTAKLNLLSRNQTWIPFATLLIGSLVGLLDDWLEVSGRGQYIAGGLSFKKRLLIVTSLSLLIAGWFFFKLGLESIFIPFLGPVVIGVWFIPLFLAVSLLMFSSGGIDGLDWLAGGILAIIFASYAGVAFFQNQIDLAAFCAVVAGSILAFLWFNIPPARFYMSETGSLGLTLTLAVVAFLTDSVVVLPIIALPLVVTSCSVIIQLASKKFRHGKKVFLVAPLHHHFEALGWPAYKVVMRYWVISVITALVGMILIVISR